MIAIKLCHSPKILMAIAPCPFDQVLLLWLYSASECGHLWLIICIGPSGPPFAGQHSDGARLVLATKGQPQLIKLCCDIHALIPVVWTVASSKAFIMWQNSLPAFPEALNSRFIEHMTSFIGERSSLILFHARVHGRLPGKSFCKKRREETKRQKTDNGQMGQRHGML